MKGAFEKVPLSVSRLMVERIVANGITLTRTSNPWNDFSVLRDEVESLGKMGVEAVVNFIFSVSPKHTDERVLRRESS